MSNYNWCHGPDCHTKHTVDRIRGTKGNKVLRTKKVTNKYGKSMYGNGGSNIWDYFCNHQCLMDYLAHHTQAVVNIAPRSKALETPIKVKKEKEQHEGSSYNHETREYTSYPYTTTRTTISRVDNA